MAEWSVRARLALGLALSALSALLATLAFPPASIELLSFIAWVPTLVAQHAIVPKRYAGVAMAVAVGGFYTAFTLGVFPERADTPYAAGLVGLALGVVLVGWLERHLHERTGYRFFLVLGPLWWVAFDFLRGGLPDISTWGYPGYALFERPTLIQGVSVTGVLGLNLLILVVNWAVAGAVLAALRHPFVRRRSVRVQLTVAGLALALWTVGGVVMLADPEPSVRVAAVQPAPGDDREASVYVPGALPERYVSATRDAAGRGAQLVVWPEYGLFGDPTVGWGDEVRDLAAETGAHIVVGYGAFGPEGNRNEAVVVTPDGKFLGLYGKQHPVTFLGEESTTRYGYPVHETALGRLGTIICYDLDFTDTARRVARGGAQLVAVPSGDWGSIATKHYPLVVFRAVENRLAMVKADIAYDSAIVDPYGRILRRTVDPGGAAAVLVADLPLGSGNTLAVTLGAWPGWVITLVALALLGRMAWLARRGPAELGRSAAP